MSNESLPATYTLVFNDVDDLGLFFEEILDFFFCENRGIAELGRT